MNEELKCENCKEEIVVLENKLFFSEEKSETTIECPICDSELGKFTTDGWFFVQSKKEYLKEIEIEQNKKKLTYPMP